jgi:hypothetical protein
MISVKRRITNSLCVCEYIIQLALLPTMSTKIKEKTNETQPSEGARDVLHLRPMPEDPLEVGPLVGGFHLAFAASLSIWPRGREYS